MLIIKSKFKKSEKKATKLLMFPQKLMPLWCSLLKMSPSLQSQKLDLKSSSVPPSQHLVHSNTLVPDTTYNRSSCWEKSFWHHNSKSQSEVSHFHSQLLGLPMYLSTQASFPPLKDCHIFPPVVLFIATIFLVITWIYRHSCYLSWRL